MSEAMSSVEIEDVLSSIRRLVSEDHRPAPRVTPAAAAPEPVADKLILTPAFRVVAPSAATPSAAAESPAPPTPEPVPTVTASPTRPGPLPRLHLGVESVTRVTASTLERAVGAQSSAWESEVGDPPLLEAQMDWSEAGWSAPADNVVPFTHPPAEPAPPSWAQVDPGLPDPEPTPPRPATEPDRQWADQAEAEAVAALEADSAADFAQDTSQPGELHLDEQVLRELVRELILAELQGTLGERMTRNVRKLVRAEIARAMSLREAE